MPLVARLLLAWLGNAAALWVADWALAGVRIDKWGPLLLAAAVLALLGSFLKPVLVVLSIPLVILTLGLFLLVINIAVLALTDALVDGFDIEGFFTYVGTVIIVWLVNTALHSLVDRD